MTLDQLIEKAEIVVEESYFPEEWEQMAGTVLAELNPIAKLLETESIAAAEGEAEILLSNLTNNFYEILAVSYKPAGKRKRLLRKLSPFDSASTGWHQENNRIVVRGLSDLPGEIIVDGYLRLGMTEEADSKVFNLPEKYHEIILKGVLAIAMQKEEELDRKNDFFGEYMMMKNQMQAERIQEMEPWYAQIVAPARLGGS